MTHIPTKWAERADKLYITVLASNATDVKVDFAEKSIKVSASGITASSSTAHEVKGEIELYKEIDPSTSSFKVLGTSIQICAVKKEEGFWNKLVDQPGSKTKNWLSIDWNLWVDEDDEQEGPADFGGMGDMGGMMGGMGGMGGMMGGMGGMGGLGGMMGGMGGMGGMNGMDFPDSDDEDEEGHEEEGEHHAAPATGDDANIDAPAADLKDLDA